MDFGYQCPVHYKTFDQMELDEVKKNGSANKKKCNVVVKGRL